MSDLTSIPQDVAHELCYGDVPEMRMTYVNTQHVSGHEWHDRYLVVFSRDGMLYGFHHDEPKTEMQEGMDEFPEDPVPVFPVVAREVAVVVYEVTA